MRKSDWGLVPTLRRLFLSAVALQALIFTPAAAPLQGQKSVRISEAPACAECRIVAHSEVLLGNDDEGVVGPNFVIQRDALGRYLVAFPENPTQFQVFDSTGIHLGSVGSRGEGGDQFTWVSGLATRDNILHVFDSPARRRAILDSAFTVLRTDPIPGQPLSIVLFPGDTAIVNTSIRTTDRVGYALHVLDEHARVVRSMGDSGGFRIDFLTSDMRELAKAGEREFWAAHVTRYVIERWSLDGRKTEVIEVDRDWFPSYGGNCCTVHPDQPPEPRIRSLTVDSERRLWIISSVADPEWHEAVYPVSTGPGSHWVDDWNAFYDSVIDVIDPSSGRLVTSHQFDEYFTTWIEPGLAASNTLVEGVLPRVRVWRLHIITPVGR